MPYLELFDETLDINSTLNYELSIQLSIDGFAFCILDTIRNKFVLIRDFEPEENKYLTADKIKELIDKDDFLMKRYKKIYIVMPSKKFTIIPAPLFDPGKKNEYFAFNHGNDDNPVLSNKLDDPDSYLVFSVIRPLQELISNIFPGLNPYHHMRPLLDHISHNRKIVAGNYLHIHVEREFFNLIIFDNNILKFCNSFNYRNISDILYFTLNVFKNLGIKQEETIFFSGLTEKYDDLISTFSLYVRHIKFAEPAGNFSLSYVFNDMEIHRFLNLFNIVNCE